MITIPLTQGKVALIDDEDAHLAAFSWYALQNHGNWYARRNILRGNCKRSMIALHREILSISDPGVVVDHRNGNGLDCRRCNLRKATRFENARNQRLPCTNSSGFKGVSWHTQRCKWQAIIRARGRQRRLGLFTDAEIAARVYDSAAREFHGEFASLNFPNQGERAA